MVRNQSLLSAMTVVGRMVFPIILCFSSCRTVPPTVEAPKNIAKDSPRMKSYKKTVEDRLGPLWYRLVKANEDILDLGTVNTTFEIPAAGGKVRHVKVISNTGGRMDELIVRRAIDQLRAPPVPPEILAHHDHVFCEETFTLFDKANPPPSPTPPKKG
jgi:hypothetical protein